MRYGSPQLNNAWWKLLHGSPVEVYQYILKLIIDLLIIRFYIIYIDKNHSWKGIEFQWLGLAWQWSQFSAIHFPFPAIQKVLISILRGDQCEIDYNLLSGMQYY